ncbi:MAG: hypothetical protein KA004_04640 [Verrucomicrobiales bacterium]|nr:hypothetical protein [Verrucomicrobiales bacterium]
MKPTGKQISDAAYAGDIELLRRYAGQGGDFNEIEQGDTLLEEIISDLCLDKVECRYDVVRELLALGADPNLLGEDRRGPMIPAMLSMDTEMLRILLEAGADPNEVAGFFDSETLYDWAEFDYRFETYDLNAPDKPTEADKADEDAWLTYLDRMAVKHGKRRPDHLYLLRKHGAKTAQELKTRANT